MNLSERPLTVLVAALGGEGGGVLADWLIDAAAAHDFPVQSTSIPGVAQRTGATTYYVEIYPAQRALLGERQPVLALTPQPGNVDVMVASELLEAGRAMQNGYVSPDRTTLIASTHRIYATVEKMHMGDGRFDSERVLKAAQSLARRAILFDMEGIARESGTVISAVLFGAMAGSGALPVSRAACEDAIRKGGKGVEPSLKGFGLAFAHASGEAREVQAGDEKLWRGKRSERVRAAFPPETHRILEEGLARVEDYQDADYGALYLNRLEPIAKLEREHGGAGTAFRVTQETGRFLALWMSYEDIIRVADLKTRRSRFERVRAEVNARPDEPVHIVEYLKPGVDEVSALLPGPLARGLRGWAERRRLTDKLNVGIHLKTTSVFGFLLMRSLAWLRPLRRMTSRYGEEQALIERWLKAVAAAIPASPELALEIALLGRLIKGYGETHRRAKANFLRIMDTLVEGDAIGDAGERAAAIRAARESALADPEGRALEGSLEKAGIAPLPPRAKPVQFVRKPGAAPR